MVAAIGDYFVWWQILLFLAMLVVWFIGGGLLLWVGGRFAAKLPKATFGRSFATNILANIAGSVVVFLVSLLVVVVGPMGNLLGWAAGLLIVWLVIAAMFKASFGKAILAWLPTIPVGIITVALLVSILLPTLGRAKEMAKRTLCETHIRSISEGLFMYRNENRGYCPPDLGFLVKSNFVLPNMFKCPSSGSDKELPGSDYFYLCPVIDAHPDTIVVCDFRDNHNGKGRNVLFGDRTVKWMTEADFQVELAKPHNAAFAAALRVAEGP